MVALNGTAKRALMFGAATLLGGTSAAHAQTQTETKPTVPASCAGAPASTSFRFDLFGSCATLSGSLEYTYQNNLSHSGSAPPPLTSGTGKPSAKSYINTIEATGTLAEVRHTPWGDLNSTITAQWTKSSDDSTDYGNAIVQELKTSLAGGTVGYTDSLMNFWSENFLMSVSTPQRTVGLISYEHGVFANTKLAIAVESGLPSPDQNNEGLGGIDFSSPAISARALYRNDDGWAFQLAAVAAKVKFPANTKFPFLSQTTTTRIGRAVTGGATVPTKFVGDNDYFSGQATYASDATTELGTQADLSSLSFTIPTAGPSTGWSEVVSFHHEWSPKWETNLFESYVAVDGNLTLAKPTVRTWRYGINLFYRPIEKLRLGVELDQINTSVAASGAAGFLVGSGGRARVGYVDVKWDF